jgi:hypothetical protein
MRVQLDFNDRARKETMMKCVFVVLTLVSHGIAVSTAEAGVHKMKARGAEDRLMWASPEANAPQAPVFRWSGRSSWGVTQSDGDSWRSNANGS